MVIDGELLSLFISFAGLVHSTCDHYEIQIVKLGSSNYAGLDYPSLFRVWSAPQARLSLKFNYKRNTCI